MCVYTPAMLTRCIMLYLSDLQCAMQARSKREQLPDFASDAVAIIHGAGEQNRVSER